MSYTAAVALLCLDWLLLMVNSTHLEYEVMQRDTSSDHMTTLFSNLLELREIIMVCIYVYLSASCSLSLSLSLSLSHISFLIFQPAV